MIATQGGGASGVSWVRGRDTAKRPAVQRPVRQQQRVIWPQLSTVLQLTVPSTVNSWGLSVQIKKLLEAF